MENKEIPIPEEIRKQIAAKATLELTAADHHSVGGTVDDKLAANPGMSEAEMMSDEQIAAYLDKQKANLEMVAKQKDSQNLAVRELIDYLPGELKKNVQYLRRINRLPESWQNFDADEFLRSIGISG